MPDIEPADLLVLATADGLGHLDLWTRPDGSLGVWIEWHDDSAQVYLDAGERGRLLAWARDLAGGGQPHA